jgi:poly(beta-D-mannuronate) lyase
MLCREIAPREKLSCNIGSLRYALLHTMRRNTRRRTALALAAVLVPLPALGAEYLVHSAAEITTAQSSAGPGDSIVMADGLWTDQNITFSDSGNASSPITLRAQTPGRVILTGSSRLTISGDYSVTSGLTFKDGALTGGQIVSITSSAAHSRFTNNAIVDYDPADINTDYEWVRVDGQENRVDHNFFKGHNHAGITVEVFPSAGSKHQVDNNHFVDRPHGNGNGWETIRIGLSSVQTRSAQALIERNLFERVDGELEIISNKTSNNTIRYNTIRASDGTITLRHGQGSRVEGNFILGEGKSGSGGIRVIGPNHVVQNNYMSDLDTNALSITTGYNDWDVATTATGYEPVDNVLIAHNTVVNVTDQVVTRDAGYSTGTNRVERPKNVTMANNLFWSTSETIVQGTEGATWTWAGNIIYGTTAGKTGTGVSTANPVMLKDAAGVWRPAANSPAINGAAAAGAWTLPADDMDGQSRVAPLDIGADESSAAAKPRGPLYGGDVGPDWLKRRSLNTTISSTPIMIFEAEQFTARSDPNGDGDTWQLVPQAGASGGAVMKAPAGTRTDVPASLHDALLEFDVAIHDPGTYFLYALCRGPDSGSDSVWAPGSLLGDDPQANKQLPTGAWGWVNLGQYAITADDVNRPITLKLGRRERDAEIDLLILSPTALTLSVPEPGAASMMFIAGCAMGARRRAIRSAARAGRLGTGC